MNFQFTGGRRWKSVRSGDESGVRERKDSKTSQNPTMVMDAAVGDASYGVGSRLVLTKDGISVPPHVVLRPVRPVGKDCLELLCREL